MFHYVKLILTGFVTFGILDFLWLGMFAQNLYKQEMRLTARYINGKLDVVWPAAFIVYIALVVSVLVFAYPRVAAWTSWWHVFLFGGLFGAVTYTIYDFTALAVLKNWSVKVSIIDVIWGFVLCGLVTLAMWWVGKM